MTSPSNTSLPDQVNTRIAPGSKVNDTARARSSANRLRIARQLHLYMGTFFAPSILFFALTGAAQVINLHETTPGSTYQPPLWLEKLAQVHKKQTLATRPKTPPRPAGQAPGRAAENPQRAQARPAPAPHPATQVLKWFFLVMSLGLVATTSLGIFLAFKYNRDPRMIWGVLFLGAAIPVVLLFL